MRLNRGSAWVPEAAAPRGIGHVATAAAGSFPWPLLDSERLTWSVPETLSVHGKSGSKGVLENKVGYANERLNGANDSTVHASPNCASALPLPQIMLIPSIRRISSSDCTGSPKPGPATVPHVTALYGHDCSMDNLPRELTQSQTIIPDLRLPATFVPTVFPYMYTGF